MFQITLINPTATPENPFAINFSTGVVSKTLFIIWYWDDDYL